MRIHFHKCVCYIWGLLLAASLAEASSGGTVHGTVRTHTGAPATDARVTLVHLRRAVAVDDLGEYRFEGIPSGVHVIQAVSRRFGSAVSRVTAREGEDTLADLRLDLEVHEETVVVTATAGPRSLSDVAAAVTVLTGTELQAAVRPSLGDTLEGQPGISSTHFGAGASRPVIRGLGGDRIRILEGGVGVADASSVSPDHNVSNDPGTADRIEVVRGPATLLYGSNAVGGVVNILDRRIPDHVPDRPLGGSVDLALSSNDDERKGSLELGGGRSQFAWHGSYLDRQTDDYSGGTGRVDNSPTDSEQWSAGASWVPKKGYVGLSYTDYAAFYGIPGDEPISIDMQQHRFDLAAELNEPGAGFRGLKLRAGHTDYTHSEIDNPTGDVGTTFNNLSTEARIDAAHGAVGPFSGTIGGQWATRDFEAIGDEAIVPPTTTDTAALFFLEEFGPPNARIAVGARYENQDIAVDDLTLPDRTFRAASGSASVLWKIADGWAVVPSISRTERPPTPEELYTLGNHPATAQFEIGDANLGQETSTGLDLTLRKTSGRVSGELNLFVNRFDDYIYLLPVGCCDAESGFALFAFQQDDADFVGGELHVDIELVHRDPHHLDFEILADTVRAKLRQSNDPLPFIPPMRVGLGLHYQGAHLWARAEGRRVAQQDRVADYGFGTTAESETGGFTLYNLSAGYRIVAGNTVHDFLLAGTNLGDELALDHVSPLKDAAPRQGRNVRASYRLTF